MEVKQGIYARYVKRVMDCFISLVATMAISPVLLIIAIAVKIDSKGPVFFLQERLGKNGKIFKIIKFRTMVVNAEYMGGGLKVKSENDNRITKVGRFLRKTSLDELPQLINVTKGDMALIGPRPPVTYHPHKYEDYPDEQKARFCVRPGITGLAQMKVRNSATWDDRIKLDVEYIKNITFIGDIRIVFGTVVSMLKSKNIYQAPQENKEMEKDNNARV